MNHSIRLIRPASKDIITAMRKAAPHAGVVYVCPERDVECGNNQRTWCGACPKRATELAEKSRTLLLKIGGHQYGLRGFGDGSLSRGRDLTQDEKDTIAAALKIAASAANQKGGT